MVVQRSQNLLKFPIFSEEAMKFFRVIFYLPARESTNVAPTWAST